MKVPAIHLDTSWNNKLKLLLEASILVDTKDSIQEDYNLPINNVEKIQAGDF